MALYNFRVQSVLSEIVIFDLLSQLYTYIDECSIRRTHDQLKQPANTELVLQSLANKVVRDLCVHYSFGGRINVLYKRAHYIPAEFVIS